MTAPRLFLPPLPRAIRGLTDNEAERLRDIHPTLPKTPRDCPTCRGKGEFRWYTSFERLAVGDFECPCVEQWRLHRFLLNCGVAPAHQRMSWADAKYVEQDAIDVINGYLDHRERYANAGLGLILHGTIGSGKSLITALLLKGLIAKGFDGYYTTFHELLDAYTSGWRNEEQRRWFDGRLRHAGVLVIDDVGRENSGRLEVAEAAFDHLLRSRVANALPTFMTTNLTMENLKAAYRSNVMSLLSEVSDSYQFTGSDFRPQAKKRFKDEILEGLTRPLVLS